MKASFFFADIVSDDYFFKFFSFYRLAHPIEHEIYVIGGECVAENELCQVSEVNLFDVERTRVREIGGVTPQISNMVLDHFFSLSFIPYLSISDFVSLFDLADERFVFGHNVVYIHYTN